MLAGIMQISDNNGVTGGDRGKTGEGRLVHQAEYLAADKSFRWSVDRVRSKTKQIPNLNPVYSATWI